MSSTTFKKLKAFLEKNEFYIFIVIMTIVVIVFIIAFFITAANPTDAGGP